MRPVIPLVEGSENGKDARAYVSALAVFVITGQRFWRYKAPSTTATI
jgi:hypothetical protein